VPSQRRRRRVSTAAATPQSPLHHPAAIPVVLSVAVPPVIRAVTLSGPAIVRETPENWPTPPI
jgi:hypothetical protein